MAKVKLSSVHCAAAIAVALTFVLVASSNQQICDSLSAFNPWKEDRPDYKWFDGPSLLQPRASSVAIVLGDGRIVVSGGLTLTGTTSTTEVFDPELKVWMPGPTMTTKRVGHTATVLADGRVLVAGGDTGSGATAACEIMNLTSGASVPVPSMYYARTGHVAVLLESGMVLVTGGTDWKSGVWKQAEAFDPATMRWSPAGSMAMPRLFASVHLLLGGSVLVLGGDSEGTSEKFDPTTNSWSGKAAMSSKRSKAGSEMLGDGRVLAAGGLSGDTPLRSAEIYDPEQNAWSGAGNMSSARASFSLTKLRSGELLAAGSHSKLGTTASCELFNPSNSTWYFSESMNWSRGAHGHVVVSCGSVFVIGGLSGSSATATVEVYATVPVEPPQYCMPIDIVPLVLVCDELPGHSQHGLVAQLLSAQAKYDLQDYETCLNIMDAFYHHVRAFAQSGHMTGEHAADIYDAYASVVVCIGGTPLPPSPEMTG